jgi:hypothetical protein
VLDLFAFLGHLQASDEDEPIVADEALFGEWVHEGCARLLGVHNPPWVCGPGSGVLAHPRGHFFIGYLYSAINLSLIQEI